MVIFSILLFRCDGIFSVSCHQRERLYLVVVVLHFLLGHYEKRGRHYRRCGGVVLFVCTRTLCGPKCEQPCQQVRFRCGRVFKTRTGLPVLVVVGSVFSTVWIPERPNHSIGFVASNSISRSRSYYYQVVVLFFLLRDYSFFCFHGQPFQRVSVSSFILPLFNQSHRRVHSSAAAAARAYPYPEKGVG
jgi:hypothetical protein